MKNATRITIAILAIVLLGSVVMMTPRVAEAGIFSADNEVTYKEYWVPHSQFTGGCNEDGTPTSNGGSWYMEPHTLVKCPKTVAFTLPDDFTNAVKIEVYLDLWRNYTSQAAMFKINNSANVYHPPVGSDWSRTPSVMEVDKSEFNVGANTMTFWGDKRYHIHDIGIRIYYNDNNPLVAGPGSDVTPPDGSLTAIEDDNTSVGPNAGGTLTVNNNKLKLTADISSDTAYVEFHAWYEGYDEDNDGIFRDWHNSGRNNWWPGGTNAQATGGTINHIGTVKPKGGATTVSYTWDMAHITNQARIKFKIRVVDAAGNVREAAGGESANFKLMRSYPVNAFIIHDFVDNALHMDGSKADSFTYNFTMPPAVPAQFTSAYLVGAYWRNPNFSLNSGASSTVGSPDWALGVKSFNKNFLVPGNNKITYIYSGSGTGHFIERPGPMFVLIGNSSVDNAPPTVSKQSPAPGAAGVDVKSPILAYVGDELFGVDWTTVVMRVNGVDVTNKAKLQGVMGEYRLYYKQGNLNFSTEYTVEIEACDLKGNCMNPASYKFNTAAPDTTPPVISDIVVTELPIGANISWMTNEPATTRIEYGKTNGYGSEIEDTELKTSHSVQVRGLQPTTLYHFKLFATDEQNNTGNSPDQTFTTLEFGELFSDDFNACQLNDGVWQVSNVGDNNLFMNGTQLEISVPGGSSHDWDSPGGPPRLMQSSSNGDVDIAVKFDSPVSLVGQTQGIVLTEDEDTYARFGFEYTLAKGPILYARFVDNGGQVKAVSADLAPLTQSPPYMRVTRTGDTWKWYYSSDGATWTVVKGNHTVPMTVVNAGFFAGNSGSAGTQPAHKAVVDYFFNMQAPIIPEDGSPIDINVTTVGNGTVSKDPAQSPYICGTDVLLTAAANVGWSFAGWTGDVNNTSPVVSVLIDEPKNVTATFTQDQYQLTVNIENDGVGGQGNKVSKSPDQETYVYDDVVQLTAVPEPGWKFVEWTGSVTGTNPVVAITMRQSETVTAKFEQEQYILTVNPVHLGVGTGGTVTWSPQKTTYLYGDVVTLNATLKPGWNFTGWSGGVTSTSLSTQLTITDDTTVTATFEQIKYDLDINVTGGGTVNRDPQKDYYLYGDVVALVADGGTCWTFKEWGGALSGNNPVEIVTITDDLTVNAVFTQNVHTLQVNKVGPGNVSITPAKSEYLCGEEVTLRAVPATNNYFAGWSDDLVGAENPLTFTIEKDTVVTATFTDNPPPTVAPIPDKSILVGQVVSFDVTATDPEDEPLTLSAEGLPDGATFVDNGDGTGVFTWPVGVGQTGTYTITFIAHDGTGQGSATVTITVKGMAVMMPLVIRP